MKKALFATILETLLSDCFGKVNLDTACTSSVDRLIWLEQYVANLTRFDQALVEYQVSNCRLVFGKVTAVSLLKTATIPLEFGDYKCFYPLKRSQDFYLYC